MKAKVSEFVYHFYGPKFRCAYCGNPSDTTDHTVPQWYVEGNVRAVMLYHLVEVAACRDCNCRLGGRVFATFHERKRAILISVFKRGKRLLQTASFDEEELAQFGRGLKEHILNATRDAEALLRRLSYLRDPTWPRGVPNELWHRDDEVWGDDLIEAEGAMATFHSPKAAGDPYSAILGVSWSQGE